MTGYYGPHIDAEIAYRQQKIAHDHAVAHGWDLALRRLARRTLQPLGFHDSGSQRAHRAAAH
ncbi:hypothetical protein [Luteipulveratus flavus]|uniref:Uncharacterized protein n=1 Tax=Luteipulveratus flavus TaxID=3031728 RepID=A0ABT6CBT2_9MICO|nr:hypothetical protein [Luteipulveratus sp. YIM 133296]MDF8265948.1 hypothetical protein [Luteipulveratus sp. YIM 133296]